MVDELHDTKQSAETLLSVDYWRRICPGLHIDDSKFQASRLERRGPEVVDRASCTDVRQRLLDEGFAALPAASLRWSIDVASLADAAQCLERHGWPPTFLAMYDEAWAMALDASAIMQEATGNSMCMDIVGFLVDPANTKGFSPHRDRQPEDWVPRGVPPEVSSTFKADGMAKYVTLWAALTDANPDNSCLHFVPKACDPGYSKGDTEDGDPMQLCFPNKDGYQNIRCEPVAQGGCTFHTHRTIHWGSSGRPGYRGRPRIALSFGFSTLDFEPPYFNPKSLPFPALGLRLALCSAQVLNYSTLSIGDAKGWIALAGGMAGCPTSMLNFLHKLFQRQSKAFHPTYRKLIAGKFVEVSLYRQKIAPNLGPASMDSTKGDQGAKDVEHGAEGSTPDKSAGRKREPAPIVEAESDEDDDALEAMLSAEKEHGEVLFHDDFDMLNSGDGGEGWPVPGGGKRKKRKGGLAADGPAKRPRGKKEKRPRA
mmetsp:Transcript_73180/g.210150  ORF Transcript_73180/g.210150 Transcript_73180/m.210150 type:complete len:482 (-) Transcript_73180:27-1472(-)